MGALRVHTHGRRRENGLGAYRCFIKKRPAHLPKQWRVTVGQGLRPIKERERSDVSKRATSQLMDIALDAFESESRTFKGDGRTGPLVFSTLNCMFFQAGQVRWRIIDQKDSRDTLPRLAHKAAARRQSYEPD